MANILFLSSLFPEKNRDFFINNSKGAISNANNSLQESLVEGFRCNGQSVYLLNVPNIGAYPSRFRKWRTLSFDFFDTKDLGGYNVGFYNFPLLKHYSIQWSLQKLLIKRKDQLENTDYIFVYDLYPPFLRSLELIKSYNPKCKIVVMIPDIIGFTHSKTSIFYRKLAAWNRQSLIDSEKFIDGFVYLTETMKEVLPIEVKDIPHIVVEGVVNPKSIIDKSDRNTVKYLFYSGSLDLRHGIMNLVKAFVVANLGNDYQLHICGDGDGREQVLEAIEGVNSIVYLGQISRQEVVDKQSKAFLLVNPRNSEGEFTKYSFPSKIIEYFFSGTPTFMYRLKGIPEEYFDYCLSLEDESVEALSLFLKALPQRNNEQLEEMGKRARNFVLTHKNARVQVEKIVDFFSAL